MKSTFLYLWICFVTLLSAGCNKQILGYKQGDPSAKSTKNNQEAQGITPKEQILNTKTILIGTYEYISGSFKIQYMLGGEGRATNYRNGKISWEGYWAFKGTTIKITKPTGTALIFNLDVDNNLTHVADMKDGKIIDLEEIYQATYLKVKGSHADTPSVSPNQNEAFDVRKSWSGNYISSKTDGDTLMTLNTRGIVNFSSDSENDPERGIWTLRNETIVVMTGTRKIVFQKLPDGTLSQIARITDDAQIVSTKESKKRLRFRRIE